MISSTFATRYSKYIASTLLAVSTFFMSGAAAASTAGLIGNYYNNYSINSAGEIDFTGETLAFSRIDPIIDFWNGGQFYRWEPIAGNGDTYGVQWEGFIKIDLAGTYGFGTMSDDGSQVWIGNTMVVNNGEGQWYDWEDNIDQGHAGDPSGGIYLTEGMHKIEVRYYEGPSYDGIELWWLRPDAGTSVIPYNGTTFHGVHPTYNPSTNWNIIPTSHLSTVPAPAAIWLFGSGALGLIAYCRRRKEI